MEYILEVSNLNKCYDSFNLSDINFKIPKGCITGFIGANGAGKTTTIKSILGLVLKDSGNVTIFGKDMDTCDLEIKNRIGVVLDESSYYEHLTMAQMKSIVAPMYTAWDDNEFNKYMEKFGLKPSQKISTLSKGMKMKFSLALALSHNAELLFMDEPTSGLDPLVRNQFLEILREYMENGERSIFFSTHITSDLDKVADMLILIDDGKIVFDEEKDALIESHHLVKGDKKDLTVENRELFLLIQESGFGFTALTNRLDEVKAIMPGVLIEKASVEDIMLGYVDEEELVW